MNAKQETIASTLQGVVVSDKMKDTIVVRVERKVKHPKYDKYIKRSTKLHVHDEGNKAAIGDAVIIEECRPLSKLKSWSLQSIKVINSVG